MVMRFPEKLMTKVKVSEATKTQLDYMVILCLFPRAFEDKPSIQDIVMNYPYCRRWEMAGPIIERGHPNYPGNKMEFRQGNTGIYASYWKGPTWWGETHPIAAMRCFVASKLGDEVDVPEELQ